MEPSAPLPPYAPPSTRIHVTTLAQLMQGGAWQLELSHDRPDHLFIWITRGQGIGLIDAARRGIGTHNAIYVPAHTLLALDPGRQCFGQVVVIPGTETLSLPQSSFHLRIRDVAAQGELTSLFEALNREQTAARGFHQAAMAAYVDLMSIWMRRQIEEMTDIEPRPTAAKRLARAFCARLVTHHATGQSMAEHAAALGVTPTHLTRVCKSETGKTAAGLLTERILHAARRLLTETDTPAQDIARHLGFGSAAYFTRFVQQHTGATPTALRRATRTR